MSMSVNNFNDFTILTRNILLRNEGEPMTSLQEIGTAANNTPTLAEQLKNIEPLMKDSVQAMKNNWLA